jgi:hypothetical protein
LLWQKQDTHTTRSTALVRGIKMNTTPAPSQEEVKTHPGEKIAGLLIIAMVIYLFIAQ